MFNKPSHLQYLVLFWILGLVSGLFSQPESYNHPELNWYSIETEHFFVHFHNGAERTAKVIAKIAEDVYEPVTSLYQYEPGVKVHFIIRDHDDYSNGAAFYYDNKIEIWATAMDFTLRGSHNWLRNVITHEFIHMIQIGSARKITQRIPAFYLQAIGYETDKREDVLHGAPDVIASYPLAMTVMPGWFAEGVAQYQLPGLDYDTWDSHRDMILRTATLENKLLTYNEMGVFGKNSIGNEKVYNHGYAFVGYLVEHYGLEKVRQVSKEMKGFSRITLDGALKKATGKRGPELYDTWVDHLKNEYNYQLQDVLQNRVEGEIIEKKGIGNFYPAWGPDDRSMAFITTFNNDYLSQTGFIARGPLIKNQEKKKTGAAYGVNWSPDGAKLAYAHDKTKSKGGAHFFDIYIYDLKASKEERVTRALRCHSPGWSPDGGNLVFITNRDGTENLATIDLKSKAVTTLTNYVNGEQLANPQWSPDGKDILFSKFLENGQDIFLLDITSGAITPVIADEYDSRDAVFARDGNRIYFSWDRTGIFNIYARDLASNETSQLTNVVGGAFMPSVNGKGELLFSTFTADGYKIALLKNPQPIDAAKTRYLAYRNEVKLASNENTIPAAISKIKTTQYDDTKIPNYGVTPYKSHYSALAFMPRAMLDYGTLKLGTYLYSFDVLDKFGFLAGFDMNKRFDYDLFALVEYRKFGPTIFIEGYNQVQNTSFAVDSTEMILRKLFNVEKATDKFRYNLLELDTGLKFKFSDANELRAAFVLSRYSAKAKFREPVGEQTLKYKYFIGRDISLRFTHNALQPYRYSDISPIGRYIEVGYDREFNKFLVDFEANSIVAAEVFKNYNYNKFTLNWKEYWRALLANHSINFEIQAGLIDARVDSFFNFFAGGIIGNRGYPYYSIEGRKLLQGRFTYRFPLFKHIDTRFMHLYFDKIFLGAFYDYGNAFDENRIRLKDFKSSVGAELRMDAFSFYSFPTRVFVNAAYGLDKFEIANQIYGNEWRFYFGISFGYLD